MKRRLLSGLLALAMTLPAVLSACGPDSGDHGSATDAETEYPVELPDENEPFDGYVIKASADGVYDISDNLFGIFLEDINFAVDGGLYAELVCNRSFEYGSLAAGGSQYAWGSDSGVAWSVINGSRNGTALNENNPQYARVKNSGTDEAGIFNTGYFEEMAIEEGKDYSFSVYARAYNGYSGSLYISIETPNGKVAAEGKIDSITSEWRKYSLTLTASTGISAGARVAVRLDRGTVDLDMVSLFPADTYKGRENGIRREIGEMLEALEPKFFRFPGGCIIEGSTLEKAYDWKDSIGNALEFVVNGETTVGDVAARPLGDNIWSWNWQPYYMSYGLGFYEYFLLCEDLGCEPVPVVNCGMSCQGQPGPNGVETVPTNSAEFRQYIQDALDLVEFCMGDTDTYWGGVRAAMGHPEPFELHYIGIGNEQWGNEYNVRYALFREAFNKAAKDDPELYGGVKLIMANGPLSSSTDGWDIVASKGNDIADLLDEHYYNDPEWFLSAGGRYDAYDREGPTVFVGEFAAKSNTSRAAIAEAAYMISLERNGDIVELAAYAPLLAYNGHTQWEPDLIWFNGSTVWGSVNYYVQKIFSANQSSRVIPSTLDGSGYSADNGLSGRIGLGTWQTSASFDDVVITDNKTGDVIFSEDFSASDISDFEVVSGSFAIRKGQLLQANTGYIDASAPGDVLYMGDPSMSSYTLTFKATKTGGAEGFIIPFAVEDSNNYWHWNIGGWGNTVSCLQYCVNGVKSVEVEGTVKPFSVKTGQEYEIKIVVDGYSVKCYVDGELLIDYDASAASSKVYSIIGEDDDDIIVKIVNASTEDVPFRINLSEVTEYYGEATVQYILFHDEDTVNTIKSAKVQIEEKTISLAKIFDYTVDAYSMVVIRVPKR